MAERFRSTNSLTRAYGSNSRTHTRFCRSSHDAGLEHPIRSNAMRETL